ncbi:unnamed protein product, partial [Tilletia caries]
NSSSDDIRRQRSSQVCRSRSAPASRSAARRNLLNDAADAEANADDDDDEAAVVVAQPDDADANEGAGDAGLAAYDADWDDVFAQIDQEELVEEVDAVGTPPAPPQAPASPVDSDFTVVGVKRAACFVRGTSTSHADVFPLWKKSKPSP